MIKHPAARPVDDLDKTQTSMHHYNLWLHYLDRALLPCWWLRRYRPSAPKRLPISTNIGPSAANMRGSLPNFLCLIFIILLSDFDSEPCAKPGAIFASCLYYDMSP
ncbi:hypothetical protein N7G274_009776 [Stereocaulon virgatum]|uniref:Uncharacterized protein n=1 Tax=Stereocaulon virgatum TaxID=373712 RepID=A0ABR3ZWE8_9LECA